jgi:hypothetical protein
MERQHQREAITPLSLYKVDNRRISVNKASHNRVCGAAGREGGLREEPRRQCGRRNCPSARPTGWPGPRPRAAVWVRAWPGKPPGNSKASRAEGVSVWGREIVFWECFCISNNSPGRRAFAPARGSGGRPIAPASTTPAEAPTAGHCQGPGPAGKCSYGHYTKEPPGMVQSETIVVRHPGALRRASRT